MLMSIFLLYICCCCWRRSAWQNRFRAHPIFHIRASPPASHCCYCRRISLVYLLVCIVVAACFRNSSPKFCHNRFQIWNALPKWIKFGNKTVFITINNYCWARACECSRIYWDTLMPSPPYTHLMPINCFVAIWMSVPKIANVQRMKEKWIETNTRTHTDAHACT